MSGAHASDSPATAKAKIQAFWKANRNTLLCNTGRMHGPVLHLAVRSSFPALLECLRYEYEVDMNYVDPTTGMTVLDFVVAEIKRFEASGHGRSDTVKALQGYYKTFRNDLGIRHAPELRESLIQ